MKRKIALFLAASIAALGLLQFTNPVRTNPPAARDLLTVAPLSPAIAAVLRAACYDCHSHETQWPWYSRVAPSSWLVVADVKEGREHLNFSDWPSAPERAAKKFDRISEVLDYREMPPKKYTLLHPEARISERQRQELLDWSEAEAQKDQTPAPTP